MSNTINIFDLEFRHAGDWRTAGLQCGVRDREYFKYNIKPTNAVEYVREQKDWNGVSLFTDRQLCFAPHINSKYKVGLLSESPIVWGDPSWHRTLDGKFIKGHDENFDPREMIIRLEDHYDFIFTYDKELINQNPKKFKFIPADWVCIEPDSHNSKNKSKLVSMIYSKKGKVELVGIGDRPLRHEVAETLGDRLDLYGCGSPNGMVDFKSDTLKDYMFSISMENCIHEYYYTEKILDCFITNNVPIFRGTSSVEKFFDSRGIIFWDTVDELRDILSGLSVDLYESMLPYIKTNYEMAKKYLDADEVLCRMINNCIADSNYNTMKEFEYEQPTVD